MAMLALTNVGIAATLIGDYEEADEISEKVKSVIVKTITAAPEAAEASSAFQVLKARSLRLEALLHRGIHQCAALSKWLDGNKNRIWNHLNRYMNLLSCVYIYLRSFNFHGNTISLYIDLC
jgi:hypothetical protein